MTSIIINDPYCHCLLLNFETLELWNLVTLKLRNFQTMHQL